ncbi:TrkA family potassium uptake protein [Thalassobacillus sp. CUG 92003]|uniref:potassium channel family protein n=1 Tax=Thalassobacillus sp. CUG 92003 TaxID=2736641 RepID=UPI0015E7322A|nr:potassium channel family protein [Thalassobacillus sp. CUG 92003]
MQLFLRYYFHLPIFLRLLLTVILFMITFGIIIHILEPVNFPTLFDGIWWAFVTGATVGYGDYVPLSTTGKIVAIMLILAGGGLVTFYMATISASTLTHEQDLSKGKVEFKGKDHIILVGWNERTRQLIQIIREHFPSDQIVLVDHTMDKLDYRHSHVHFIKGDITEDKVMDKANVKLARSAMVTADPSRKEKQSDQFIIHSIVALIGYNANLTIIAEILTENQRINALRAGAKTVLRSNDFMSSLFYHELYRSEPAQPFQLLLDILTERKFLEEQLPKELKGKPVTDGLHLYLEENRQLIGYKRDGKLHMDLTPQQFFQSNDTLIFLSPLR